MFFTPVPAGLRAPKAIVSFLSGQVFYDGNSDFYLTCFCGSHLTCADTGEKNTQQWTSLSLNLLNGSDSDYSKAKWSFLYSYQCIFFFIMGNINSQKSSGSMQTDIMVLTFVNLIVSKKYMIVLSFAAN